MPTYQYRCTKCEEQFERQENVKEHETHPVRCPKCGSEQVTQLLSAFYAKTSKKS
jgi:putative FmdB family regulatory protein